MSTKHDASPPPKQPSEASSAPEADFDDTIARNRSLPIVEVAPRPAEYRETDAEVRKRRLRRMGADQQAEAMLALGTLVERAPFLEEDFSKKYAPDAKKAAVLHARLKKVGAARAAAEKLLTCLKELEEIAWSDTTVLLEGANKQIQHAVDQDPGIATTYATVVTVFEQRSAAISEGRARAKSAAMHAAPVPEPERPGAKTED